MAHEFKSDEVTQEMTDDMVRSFEKAFRKFHRPAIEPSGQVARSIMLDLFAKAYVRATQQVVPDYARERILDGAAEKVAVVVRETRREDQERDGGIEKPIPGRTGP